VRAFVGLRGKPWTQLDNRLGVIFTSVLDLNLLIGLLLFFLSDLTTGALKDLGAAMGNDSLRFFAIEHWLIMLVAVVLAHVGWARAKKAPDDRGKFKQVAIFFTLALLVVLAAIPWPFLAAGAERPWIRL